MRLANRLRHAWFWRPLIAGSFGALLALYLALPVVWLVRTSLMAEIDAMSVPPRIIPEKVSWEAYALLFNASASRPLIGVQEIYEVLPSLGNSTLVAVSVAFLNLLFGAPAAYALARLTFAANRWFLFLYVLTRMVPLVALMIPLYLVVRSIGLLNTRTALIVVHTALTLPFTVWLLKEYFSTVPRDLEDAARVDRCNWLRMMLYVLLPVAAPGLIAASMFAFMFSWNEFLFALLFTNTIASKTVTVAVAGFISDLSLPRTVVAAAGVLALLPPVFVALLLQRQITQGLVAGAVKG
jgi:multiple sugar transport system permease protein